MHTYPRKHASAHAYLFMHMHLPLHALYNSKLRHVLEHEIHDYDENISVTWKPSEKPRVVFYDDKDMQQGDRHDLGDWDKRQLFEFFNVRISLRLYNSICVHNICFVVSCVCVLSVRKVFVTESFTHV